jgi:hypothetical protein
MEWSAISEGWEFLTNWIVNSDCGILTTSSNSGIYYILTNADLDSRRSQHILTVNLTGSPM